MIGLDRHARLLLAVLAGLTVLRGVFAFAVQLSPDEAYYWTWSMDLSAGYYDHPPAVAFLIRAGTAVAGDNPLGVRLGALVCGALASWMVFVITLRLTAEPARAFWVALLAALSPVLSTGSVIHTPDASLVCCWSLAIWLALRAFENDRWQDWIGLGAAAGLACLSKGSGLLLVAGVGLFAVSCKAGRDCLLRPGMAVGLLVAAVIVSPNLVWNIQNQGGSLAFQLEHAFGELAFRPLGLFEFAGAQAGVVSPLLWLGLVGFAAVGWRRQVRFGRWEAYLLWCLSGPVLLGAAMLSTVHRIEANWPAVAYLAALPGMAWALTGGVWYLRRRRLWTGVALGLALGLTLLAHLQALSPLLPLAPGSDPTDRLRGWRQMADQAVEDADALGAGLASEGYGPVSELLFYTGRQVAYEPSSARRSQYDLRPGPTPSGRLLFLQPVSTPYPPRSCDPAAERWQLIRESGPDRESKAGAFRWWVCEGVGGR